jgi:hypothetical protein
VFEVLVPEGNRFLDGGRVVGPALVGAWELVERVLDVAPTGGAQTIKVEGTLMPPEGGSPSEDGVLTTPPEVPPPDDEGAQKWARRWAEIRLAEKRRKNFAEADRIRALLRTHGWEVQDAKDGSIQIRKLGGG